ncbi:reverse transcriptase [Abeliophyllum distichum]|uniref:Reverse transcriptase n=1 Tax=Abeliophyllum distichum TaxID=126358 RepID=A0ABD1RF32_9LAMI
MEITEYEQKFEELSHYAPYLVSTELMKARRYERGLRPEFKRHNQGPIRGQSSNTIPQCPKCKKNHNGNCYFGKNVFYRCGEPGHYVLQCRAEPVKVYDQMNKGKARVFAMTQGEVAQNPDVITADLHVISMRDFDIILGMDWLGSNRATIVCFEKEVIFRRSGEKEFKFYGSKIKALPCLFSALQAEKLLKKIGCQGYLVNLTSTLSEEVSLDNIPIV